MVPISAIAVNCNFLSFEVYLGPCQKQNDRTFLRKTVHYFHKKFPQKISPITNFCQTRYKQRF